MKIRRGWYYAPGELQSVFAVKAFHWVLSLRPMKICVLLPAQNFRYSFGCLINGRRNDRLQGPVWRLNQITLTASLAAVSPKAHYYHRAAQEAFTARGVGGVQEAGGQASPEASH